MRETICAIESALTFRFALRGEFGVDLMMDGDTVRKIEADPRLLFSAEVIARSSGWTILAIHRKPFISSTLPAIDDTSPRTSCGKAILFARELLFIALPLQLSQSAREDNLRSPTLADLPRVGSYIERAHPIVTIFARCNI